MLASNTAGMHYMVQASYSNAFPHSLDEDNELLEGNHSITYIPGGIAAAAQGGGASAAGECRRAIIAHF